MKLKIKFVLLIVSKQMEVAKAILDVVNRKIDKMSKILVIFSLQTEVPCKKARKQ